MTRKYAVKLTPRDEIYLRRIRKCGFVSLSYASAPQCGLESNESVPYARFKRLLALGYLASNRDGLLDELPQTYRPVEPAPEPAGACGGLHAVPAAAPEE